jgi:hypothetical protein
VLQLDFVLVLQLTELDLETLNFAFKVLFLGYDLFLLLQLFGE